MSREIVFYNGCTTILRWSRTDKLRHYKPTAASDKRLAQLLVSLCGLGLATVQPASPLNLGARYTIYDDKPTRQPTL